jgi:hypothetical protein
MKQIVVHLEPSAHAALKERAKLNRRSIGNQLIWEAMHNTQSAKKPKRGDVARPARARKEVAA